MIRKIDFADDLLPRLEAQAARLKTNLSGLVNILVSQGVDSIAAPVQAAPGPCTASAGPPEGPERGPGEPYRRGSSLASSSVVSSESSGSGESGGVSGWEGERGKRELPESSGNAQRKGKEGKRPRRARSPEEDAAREEADDWYRTYPKKVDPDGTKAKYVHLRLTGVLPPRDVMFERLERQKACDQWLRGFIPHSKTYLNQKRWEDSNALPEEPQPAALPLSPVEPIPRLAAVLVGNRYEDRVWLAGQTYTRDEWTAMGRAWPGKESER